MRTCSDKLTYLGFISVNDGVEGAVVSVSDDGDSECLACGGLAATRPSRFGERIQRFTSLGLADSVDIVKCLYFFVSFIAHAASITFREFDLKCRLTTRPDDPLRFLSI